MEILEDQYNEQLNIVISREIQLEVLHKLDPERVIEIRIDQNMEARKITAKDMIRNAEEKQSIDLIWLKVLEERVREERKASLETKGRGGSQESSQADSKKTGVE